MGPIPSALLQFYTNQNPHTHKHLFQYSDCNDIWLKVQYVFAMSHIYVPWVEIMVYV